MEQSILISTKKVLGLTEDYTAFDHDIIMHINTAFSILAQLGIGPTSGFMIEDDSADWTDFLDVEADPRFISLKSWVFLKVKMMFDPPSTSYLITSMENQIRELEWRLNITAENDIVEEVA